MVTEVGRPTHRGARNPLPPELLANRRLLVLLVAVIGGGAGILVGSALQIWNETPPAGWRLGLAATLGVLGNAPLLRLRFGRHGSSFNYGEAAVILLLPLLPAAELFVVTACAVAVTQLANRQPVRKLAFNTSSFLLGLALAELVLAWVGPISAAGVLNVREMGALVLALAGFSLLENAAVAAAVAFSQRLPFLEVARRGVGVNTLVALVNVAVGLGILQLARWDWHTLLPLPAFGLTLLGSYRGYVVATEARDTWQRLELAGKELNQLDEDALADAVLRNAVRLFMADWAELAIEPRGELPARTYRRGPDEANVRGTATSSTSVQLRDTAGDLGALRLGFAGPVKLTERENQVLANFARSASGAVSNARLYSELRLEAARKEFEATHDALTGLANRRLLLAAANSAARDVRPGTVCALLLVDLDHFKGINDALGHAVGDALLCIISDRLALGVGRRGIVARLSGDEFVVLLPSVDEDEVEYVASELQLALAEPAAIEGVRLTVEATVGAACLPTDCDSANQLLQRADVALARAKASTSAYRRYRAGDDGTSVEQLELAAELRTALARDELVVQFQPQLDLSDGAVVGVEALTRWQHPTRGLLPPSEFIPIVEQSGLVRPFTLHVLKAAVAQAALWSRRGLDVQVAVNLSARTLLDRQLPDDVAHILRRSGVRPSQVVLEITETTMMRDLDIVESVLASLRALGVELSVDDFGTGYSSLALLQRVAINEIKVDKSFVRGMAESENDRAIVRATVELAHGLGVRVVAEGVETAALLHAVRSLGCDRVQGYFVGTPVDPGELDLTARPVVRLPEPAQRPRLAR